MVLAAEVIEETGKRPSLVDDAYSKLKDAIRENEFPPGYQGSEQEMASRLGMSRTPVHEAVIRLQEEGLVRVLPRRGVVVCAISSDDMREIYDVIIALETAAAELLSEKPPQERLSTARELESANKSMENALKKDDLTGWELIFTNRVLQFTVCVVHQGRPFSCFFNDFGCKNHIGIPLSSSARSVIPCKLTSSVVNVIFHAR